MARILSGGWWRRPAPPPPPQPGRDVSRTVVQALQRAWHGAGDGAFVGDPEQSSAATVAIGAYSRALGTARIEAPAQTAAALAAVLHLGGGAHVCDGEFALVPHFDGDGGLELRPVRIVEGDADTWTVREVDRKGDYVDRRRPVSDVALAITHPDPANPLRGRSPVDNESGRALASLERCIADESALPLGVTSLVASPSELDDEFVSEWYAGFNDEVVDQRGGSAFLIQGTAEIVSGSSGWMNRYGPQFSGPYSQILTALTIATVVACGIPASLMVGTTGGTSIRDAWRAFLSGSAQAIAEVIARAVATTLGQEISIDVVRPQPTAADVVSRARGFKLLVDGGIEPDRALEIAGLSP